MSKFTLEMAITALTKDDEIEKIPFLDMRREASERLNDARAIWDQDSEDEPETVLEYHDVGGVCVLYSPCFGYALVNEPSPGVGDSLLIDNGECKGPEHAAQMWREGNVK